MTAHHHGSPGSGHDDHAHLDEMEVRVRALETLLTEKGYVEAAAIDRIYLYRTVLREGPADEYRAAGVAGEHREIE